MATQFEILLSRPPFQPPHLFLNDSYRSEHFYPWIIDRASGKCYCPMCACVALSHTDLEIEALGLRSTVSRKLLGENPTCGYCGRRRIWCKTRAKKPRTRTKSATARTLRSMGNTLKRMFK